MSQENFVPALIISFFTSAFLALLFRELRLIKQEKLGLDYKSYYDYYYVYGWVVLSAAVAVAISLTIGRNT